MDSSSLFNNLNPIGYLEETLVDDLANLSS